MKEKAFDLHVLGTPPTFILSQDQTLRKTNTISGVDYEIYILNRTLRYTSFHSSVVKVQAQLLREADSTTTLFIVKGFREKITDESPFVTGNHRRFLIV